MPAPATTAREKMVGATGFEPATSCSRSRRATKLRYAPSETLRPGLSRLPGVLAHELHEHALRVGGDAHRALHLLDHLQRLVGHLADRDHHPAALRPPPPPPRPDPRSRSRPPAPPPPRRAATAGSCGPR